MPLVEGDISTPLQVFIENLNASKQTDANTSIEQFCNQMETLIFAAIKSITITIPPGFVIVAGSPTTQTNPEPIALNEVVT